MNDAVAQLLYAVLVIFVVLAILRLLGVQF